MPLDLPNSSITPTAKLGFAHTIYTMVLDVVKIQDTGKAEKLSRTTWTRC
jgi:hypothetical protein